MFKFLKSKKGFTLVELMIVVVIMAILVAVAVPIYSAVTKNARRRTCIGNMREIVSQINNYAMSNPALVAVGGSATISSTKEAGSIDANTIVGHDVSGTVKYEKTDLQALFQSIPYCPAGGVYTISTAASGLNSEEAGSMKVTVTCTSTDATISAEVADHKLSGTN